VLAEFTVKEVYLFYIYTKPSIFPPEDGVSLVSKRGCLLTLAYYTFPRWYEFGERRWNDTAYWQGKTEELVEKPFPVPLCPPQIPHGLTRARTRTFVVTGRQLTTWAMAQTLPVSVFEMLTVFMLVIQHNSFVSFKPLNRHTKALYKKQTLSYFYLALNSWCKKWGPVMFISVTTFWWVHLNSLLRPGIRLYLTSLHSQTTSSHPAPNLNRTRSVHTSFICNLNCKTV
jgi:hypothetical protein